MTRSQMEMQFATQVAISSRQWRLLGDQALARLGLSNTSGWCIVFIQRLGDDTNQADLARAVGVREPSLVRTLAGLEEQGLIERTPHPDDGRAKLTRLSPKGAAIATQVEESLSALRRELLADVSDDDLATALSVFSRVSAALPDRKNRS